MSQRNDKLKNSLVAYCFARLRNTIKPVFVELRQFEQYVKAYLDEISFQMFTLKNIQSALMEHLDIDGEDGPVAAIISRRKAEFLAEQDRLKVEREARETQIMTEAGKLNDSMEPNEEAASKAN